MQETEKKTRTILSFYCEAKKKTINLKDHIWKKTKYHRNQTIKSIESIPTIKINEVKTYYIYVIYNVTYICLRLFKFLISLFAKNAFYLMTEKINCLIDFKLGMIISDKVW